MLAVTLITSLCWSPNILEKWPGGGNCTAGETMWGMTVDAVKVRSEYPRPQLVRSDSSWISLNGIWNYNGNETNISSVPQLFNKTILVPYPTQSGLSGVRQLPEHGFAWYQRSLLTTSLPTSKGRYILHVEKCDWNCTVYIDSNHIGWHAGGFDPWSLDITTAVSNKNNITISIGVDDREQSQVIGKQDCSKFSNPYGTTYTCITGIWDTIWIETVPILYLRNLEVSFLPHSLSLKPSFCSSVGDNAGVGLLNCTDVKPVVPLEMSLIYQGELVTTVSNSWTIDTSTINVLKWPALYFIKISLSDDEFTTYSSIRQISTIVADDGFRRPTINGEVLFYIGLLSQGYYPDGGYTAATDAAMQWDILYAKRLGFNALRVHQKVEPRRYYYHADRLGMILLQDMPSSKLYTSLGVEWFSSELQAMAHMLKNVPSVVQYQVFNERSGGTGDCGTVCENTRTLKNVDGNERNVIDVSGGGALFPGASDCCCGCPSHPPCPMDPPSNWTGHCCGCNCGYGFDSHHYPDPISPIATSLKTSFANEYGGLKLSIPSHSWYQGRCGALTVNSTQLVANYTSFASSLIDFKSNRGMSGAIYTQISDVECECNGLQTYDRYSKLSPEEEEIIKNNNVLLRNA